MAAAALLARSLAAGVGGQRRLGAVRCRAPGAAAPGNLPCQCLGARARRGAVAAGAFAAGIWPDAQLVGRGGVRHREGLPRGGVGARPHAKNEGLQPQRMEA